MAGLAIVIASLPLLYIVQGVIDARLEAVNTRRKRRRVESILRSIERELRAESLAQREDTR